MTIALGTAGDRPVPADYDGDGRLDPAVFRSSNATWYVLRSSVNQIQQTAFGLGTDIPVPPDFDGDGSANIAVFRPSNGAWYLNRSTSGFTGVQFGASGDQPTPNAFVR